MKAAAYYSIANWTKSIQFHAQSIVLLQCLWFSSSIRSMLNQLRWQVMFPEGCEVQLHDSPDSSCTFEQLLSNNMHLPDFAPRDGNMQREYNARMRKTSLVSALRKSYEPKHSTVALLFALLREVTLGLDHSRTQTKREKMPFPHFVASDDSELQRLHRSKMIAWARRSS